MENLRDQIRISILSRFDHKDALEVLETYCDRMFIVDARKIDLLPCENCTHTYLAHYGQPTASCTICDMGHFGIGKDSCTGYQKRTSLVIEGEVIIDRKELL